MTADQMTFDAQKIEEIKERDFYTGAEQYLNTQDNNDDETRLADALSYFMYWAHFNNVDFDAAVARAAEYCKEGL